MGHYISPRVLTQTALNTGSHSYQPLKEYEEARPDWWNANYWVSFPDYKSWQFRVPEIIITMDSTDKNGEPPRTESPSSELNQQDPPNEGKSSSQAVDGLLQPAPGLADELKNYDWDQLLEKYADAMEEHAQADEQVRNQTAKLQEVSEPANYYCCIFLTVCVGFCELVSNNCPPR